MIFTMLLMMIHSFLIYYSRIKIFFHLSIFTQDINIIVVVVIFVIQFNLNCCHSFCHRRWHYFKIFFSVSAKKAVELEIRIVFVTVMWIRFSDQTTWDVWRNAIHSCVFYFYLCQFLYLFILYLLLLKNFYALLV